MTPPNGSVHAVSPVAELKKYTSRVASRVQRVQLLVVEAAATVTAGAGPAAAPAPRGAKLERRPRSACAPATKMGLLVELAAASLSPQPAAPARWPLASDATARPPPPALRRT